MVLLPPSPTQAALRKIEARCHIIGSNRLAERIRHCADSDDGWVSAMYFNATLWGNGVSLSPPQLAALAAFCSGGDETRLPVDEILKLVEQIHTAPM